MRAAVLIVLVSFPARAQGPVVPIPPNVTVEGVPAIPQTIADGMQKYAGFRQAVLLDWQRAGRGLLMRTTAGSQFQIHRVDAPGAGRVQITKEQPGVTSLFVSVDPADGKAFVFLWDPTGGREANQLYRYDLRAGSSTMLTDGHARYGPPIWARRGKLIAYTSTRRNGKDMDLYVMEPGTRGSERLVAQLEGQWRAWDWTPDGRSVLAIETVATSTESYIWRVDVKTGEKTLLTPHSSTPALWDSARWGADGRTVYAISDRGADMRRLWRRTAKGQWAAVTPANRPVQDYAISDDGALLAVAFDNDASTSIEIFDRRSMRKRPIPSVPAGRLVPFSTMRWRPGSHELGFTHETVSSYGEIYSLDVDARKLVNWKQSEVTGFDPSVLPAPEIIRWKSFDGRLISGVYYRPPARFTGPRPVIVNIHGGPADREQPRFLGRSNYFLNEQGIALIYPNVRGSDGFGRAFSHLDDGPKRGDAIKDVGALLDWIAAQPALDKTRVMLTGPSYGGWLTLMAAAAYSDRIRCAFEAAGMTDLPTFLEQRDASVRQDRREEYGDERDPATRAFLTEMSPITHAAEIRKPLAIAHGGNDTRIPPEQAENIAKAVRANGVSVWFFLYKDEGHDNFLLRRPPLNNFNFQAWILFVQTYLLN